MSAVETKPAFLRRFDSVWSKKRRAQIGHAICTSVLIAATGFALLAALDYWFEISKNDRAVGLAIVVAVSLSLALTWIHRAVRRNSRPQTATEIEEQFPELGQAVRTNVQFAAHSEAALEADGVQGSLVTALAEDTEQRAAPLKIDSIVPSGRLALVGALAALVITVLLVSAAVNWEWRTAVTRVLLGDQDYTELAVSPGNLTVEEGQSLALTVEIAGRTNRAVLLSTRPADSTKPWTERELIADDAVATQPRLVKYQTTVPNIIQPLEYRVTAGPAASETYRVEVRHPLAMQSIRAEVTPPAYTGIEPSTVENGNLNVIDGSTVKFAFTLDRAPKTAKMLLTERGVGPGESDSVVEIPLLVDQATLSTTLEFTRDQTYSIVAEAADGMVLPENKFRIRVRYDQPPQVWFEEPEEELEVHSIAEVLLRFRTRDDFGLTRAGIVFEVNNEEEYTLLEKDYRQMATALAEQGQPVQQTRDAMQRLLPLELFHLEEKDSVTYYAFAEDSFPQGTHHVETDLRFIDIRPFRRVYRLPDPNALPGANNTPQVRSLRELISRQRFNLNRTIRLQRKAETGGEPTLVEVDRIGSFEDELSKSTHELAEFLDEREFDGSDLLFQAETVMLTSVDSLNVGKYDISAQQQKDALRLLIEARTTIEIFLRRNANAAQRNALGSFDRQQIQKLRKPKRDAEDEEDPEQLAERIRRLASVQDNVFQALTGGSAESENSDPAEMSRAEIEAQQQDIAVEARDVERIVNRIRNMSELARERSTAAADGADNVSGALSRGSTPEATETAQQTSETLSELALNVEGVMAGEPSEKIGMSRDLAGTLAALERRLVNDVEAEPARAVRLAETGRTVEDILNSVVETNSPGDREAVRRVDAVLAENDVSETVQRMTDVAAMLREGRTQDAKVEGEDVADRLDVLAGQLDQVYRSIVAPRVEQLTSLEGRAVQLKQELQTLQTNQQISTWHREALELAEDLDKADAVGATLDELYETMQAEGWSKMSDQSNWGWPVGESGFYVPPDRYGPVVHAIVEELQQRMQSLILTDLLADDNEATPPKYRHFVERYIEVLSSDVQPKE